MTYERRARGLLAAVLIQALKDARTKEGYEREQARQFIIDDATWITQALYGLGLDGLWLLEVLDNGELDHIIHYKPQRYARPVHRCDRQQIQPLPDFLSERLLTP